MVGTFLAPTPCGVSGVLIPLKSGHGWHMSFATARVGVAVLIPLKSGHGWHKELQAGMSEVKVLIPLKSGHGWHDAIAIPPGADGGLNPFEIRAWLART